MNLPRLQLHLSTLLIVTLLAAALVWLNIRPLLASHDQVCTVTYGVPYPAAMRIGVFYKFDREENSMEQNTPDQIARNVEEYFRGQFEVVYVGERGWAMVPKGSDFHLRWNPRFVVLDLLCFLALLSVVAVGIQWLTRRMKRGAA